MGGPKQREAFREESIDDSIPFTGELITDFFVVFLSEVDFFLATFDIAVEFIEVGIVLKEGALEFALVELLDFPFEFLDRVGFDHRRDFALAALESFLFVFDRILAIGGELFIELFGQIRFELFDLFLQIGFDLGEDIGGQSNAFGVRHRLAGGDRPGGQVWEWIEQITVADREVEGADPVVKGFAKFVDTEFFDMEGDDRVAGGWCMKIALEVCVSCSPSGDGVFRAWIAALAEEVDGLGHHGVAQVNHLDIGVWSEDFSTVDIV